MNSRLGDIGIDDNSPAWARESSDNDFETMEEGEDVDEMKAINSIEDESVNGGEDFKKADLQMEKFFSEVDIIKGEVEAIKSASRRISEINEEAVLATASEKENELSRELKELITETNKKAKSTKTVLGYLKEDNTKMKEDKSVSENNMRIRENLCNTVTRKFIDEMKEYQSAQQKYKSDIKKKVKRQVQIVKPDATDEEVEEVMRSEGGRDALYREQILAGGVNDNIKTAFQNAVGKYQDVKTLESSMAELYQMFLDFALLTEQQGELLDQIEFNVKSASDYIEEANVEIHTATVYQKSAQKKKCYIILIAVTIGSIVIYELSK